MGLYDNVIAPEVKCIVCGNMVDGWQSKDGRCMMTTIQAKDVIEYYTSCDYCNCWIEF